MKDFAWPAESLDYEQRFGGVHARLYPFIGKKVTTPLGVATLVQVFSERATVELDAFQGACVGFPPSKILLFGERQV